MTALIPPELTKEVVIMVFYFLDDLRLSGITNMWGATPYIQSAFPGLSLEAARWVHVCWMETFSPELTAAERAAKAFAP